MNRYIEKYALISLKCLLALTFSVAGFAKLAGVEMMILIYEQIGVGQWFRYVTAVIEIISAILLMLPGKQVYGAILLVCTMIGAVFAHLFILGPSALPAFALGALSTIVLYVHRNQLLKKVQVKK